MGRSPTARTRRARRTSADSRSSTCPHARRRWSGLPRSPSPAAVLKRSASSCPTRRWATDRSPTWPVHAHGSEQNNRLGQRAGMAPEGTFPCGPRAAGDACRLWRLFSARLLVVNAEGRLLRGRRKAALDAFVHARHQHVVAEAFPALLRVVNGDDRPAVSRRPRGRSAPRAGSHRSDARPRSTPRTAPAFRRETDARCRTPSGAPSANESFARTQATIATALVQGNVRRSNVTCASILAPEPRRSELIGTLPTRTPRS